MRLLVLLITLLGLFGLTYLYGLPHVAERMTVRFLSQSSLENIQIEGLRASFSGIHIDRIQFDEDGFNTIKNLNMEVNWTKQKILRAEIEELQSAHIANSPHQLVTVSQDILDFIPGSPLLIQNFITDIATEYGDIRLEGSLNLSAQNEQEEQFITLRLRAQQFQVSFDSLIEGVVTKGQIKNLSANIQEGRTNFGPFQFSRMSGWITYDEDQTPMTLAGQIDIGAGRFHELALNRVSLVIGGTRLAPEFLFRSGLSGHPDLQFSVDYSAGKNPVFRAVLQTQTLTPVFETLHPDKNVPEALSDLKDIDLSLTYMPERRFAGGPYPFELLLKEGKEQTLTGTALFYPDTLGLRGSAESSEELAKAMADYFGLPADGQTDKFLRLDTSLKSWFILPKNQKQD